jgi:trafficking protein particle complex subunit 4
MYLFGSFLAGIKFLVVADPKQQNMDLLLKRIYELYADFALKNPFYSLEMPIRCELFDTNLQSVLEQAEKTGVSAM